MLEANTIVPIADALSSRCNTCGKILEWKAMCGTCCPEIESDSMYLETSCCGNEYILAVNDVIVEIRDI